ncbi:hypothetical protein, partial [Streptomyces sp. GSL17-113]|uniref:hypothetical protein n=1 Tax=Streptomyces sp. GSL17-113 TaxID=3115365 RepID=UPI002E7763B0
HHIALPRVDGEDSVEQLTDAQSRLVARIAESWKRPAPQALRVLPELVTAADLAAAVSADPAEGQRWAGHGPALADGEVPI